MSDKKNIIITTLIFILFFLLFPLKLEKNLSYHSNESKNLLEDDLTLPINKIPYIFRNRAGYFSSDLKNSWSIEINDGITLLKDGYVNNSREDDRIIFKDFNGIEQYTIKDSGYPFSFSNRFFIISRDRKSLSEIENGEKKWTKFFNYIITSISGNKEDIAIGFLNGSFGLFDTSGESFYEYEPGGSRVSVIYGCSLSKDSKYLAVISGLGPQRFILYEKKDTEYRPIYTLNLDEEVRTSLKIFITADNKSIFVEAPSGFYIVNIENRTSTFLDGNYSLKNVEYLEDLDLYMVYSGAINYNNIKLITKDNGVLLEKQFIGKSVSVTTKEKSIYIVIDNSVIKLDIKE